MRSRTSLEVEDAGHTAPRRHGNEGCALGEDRLAARDCLTELRGRLVEREVLPVAALPSGAKEQAPGRGSDFVEDEYRGERDGLQRYRLLEYCQGDGVGIARSSQPARDVGDRVELAVEERPAVEEPLAPPDLDEHGERGKRRHHDGGQADPEMVAKRLRLHEDVAGQDGGENGQDREEREEGEDERAHPVPLPQRGRSEGRGHGGVQGGHDRKRDAVCDDRLRLARHACAKNRCRKPRLRWGNGEESPTRLPARLLRGRGAGGRHRRAGARAVRRPGLRRKQIVHNAHVVHELEERGAIFVDSEEEVPQGSTLVFSAHGVAPSVHENSAARGHHTIDATCPLVTKVHVQARRYAAEGYTIFLIGHAGHEEIEGTMGEAPESIILVESIGDVEALDLPSDTKVAYITQTTLSVDETAEMIAALRRRFPQIYAPKKEDICYATSNRQWAVKEMLPLVDLLLVIGSKNSSNSNRLVEVARANGVQSHLIEDETEIDDAWLDGVETAGITSGASAPERLVVRVVDWFRAKGIDNIEPYELDVREDITFRLPVELRRELQLAEPVAQAF